MAPSTRRSGKREKTRGTGSKEQQKGPADTSAGVSRGAQILPIIFLIGLALARLGYQWFYSSDLVSEPSPGPTYKETAPGAAYVVVDIPGKGKGAVAIRDIQQGETILEEKPIIMVPPTINSSPVEFLKAKLKHLNDTQRAAFWGLSFVNFPKDKDPEKDKDDVALAIFETNAVKAGSEVGLFPRMARLNHGCSSAFNAVYSFRETEGSLYIHAIKPIAAGEELLTTYTDTKKPRDQRRAYLEQSYGFRCTCSVCSLPEEESKASDARLVRMSTNWARFAKWIDGAFDGVEAIRLVREIWKDGEAEGYWSERGRLAADAVWVAAGHSDADAVRKWAALATQWYDIELGVGNEHSYFSTAMIEQPERHPAWGKREPMTVGGPEGI